MAWDAFIGFVTANDNVQPLALVACERFGSTLAMSSDTINKVQHTVLPTPQPATVSFLKAAVGFSRNDCATQLGRHEGGIRFLGLAAALVTSLGAFESAKSLAVMLKRTTDDDLTMMPSVLHLKDLLSSLEARSHRCGFAESVVGWQILLRKAVLPSVFSDETRRRLTQKSLDRLETELLKSTPSPEALAGLVDAFRQVARMGPDTVLGATIRVGAAAPWVLAFAQWCVEPPSLYVGDKVVLEQPGSRLNIIISGAADDIGKPFEVTIHHRLENLSRLLGPPSRKLTTGMATVESYRTWLLQELGFNDDREMLRLLHEALRYAVPQVLRKMKCGRFARLSQEGRPGRWLGSTDNSEDSCRLSLLPNIRVIANTCATILALNDPVRFAPPDDSTSVDGLPLVTRHLQPLTTNCMHIMHIMQITLGPYTTTRDRRWMPQNGVL